MVTGTVDSSLALNTNACVSSDSASSLPGCTDRNAVTLMAASFVLTQTSHAPQPENRHFMVCPCN